MPYLFQLVKCFLLIVFLSLPPAIYSHGLEKEFVAGG